MTGKIYYCAECGFEFDKSFLKNGLCNQCRIELVGWDDFNEQEKERINLSQWYADEEVKDLLGENVKKIIERCSKK